MIKLNGIRVDLNKFPDGTLFMKPDFSTARAMKNGPYEITWNYENDGELFALICLTKKLKEWGHKVNLMLPYIPNARMDRAKLLTDIFTLKSFAEVINSLDFNTVYVLDAHSNVSLGLIDRVQTMSVYPYISHAIKKVVDDNLIFFYPDEGSAKRYADMIGKPYAFGIKKRDWSTGQILGLDIIDNGIDLKGKTILIIDDICSKGGTFYHSAKKLKELGGGNVYLYVTHCENTILEGEVLTSGLIEKVFTTNSIFTKDHEKVEVIKL